MAVKSPGPDANSIRTGSVAGRGIRLQMLVFRFMVAIPFLPVGY
jgi:hypothetical protein